MQVPGQPGLLHREIKPQKKAKTKIIEININSYGVKEVLNRDLAYILYLIWQMVAFGQRLCYTATNKII